MAHVLNPDTWLTVYHLLSKADRPKKIVFDSALSSFNSMCEEYANNDTPLLNALVDGLPCRTLILPSSKKGTVNVIHSCTYHAKRAHRPFIVGIHGLSLSAPWKAIHVKHVVTSLQQPASTRSSIITPSLKQFSSINGADEFQKLNGDESGHDIKNV
jgi:hypothetical protein